MLGLHACCEHFDDDHTSAATRAGQVEDPRLVWVCILYIIGFVFRRHVNAQQRPRPCDVGGAIAVGEQPVVADAVEAFRQDVGEETADEENA